MKFDILYKFYYNNIIKLKEDYFMVIEGRGILLRPFTLNDVNEFYLIAHDKAVKEFVPYAYCATRRKAKELVANYVTYDFKNDFYYAICNATDGKMIGAIMAYRIPNSQCLDVSGFIGANYRRKGYMLAATMLFIDAIAKNTKLECLRFTVSPYNQPSMSIMWTLGLPDNGDEMIYFYPLSWARKE